MTKQEQEHDPVRQRISELTDPRRVAHDHAVARHKESVSADDDRKAMMRAASRRSGMDMDNDFQIQRWRGEARHGAMKPKYRGST